MFEKLVEEHIQAAQERGEFNALRGAGKPLPPDDAGLVPEEFRMAYRVLKNLNALLADVTDTHEARRIGRRMSLLAANLGLRPDTPYYYALNERLRK